ncbi:MAG TPA: molybdopterin-dependent oxidoreductase [Syntrophomonas sp.]|nr:molybdopterin-dependent oxidoreductase [Syntrophomonas sp.]
MSEELKKVNCFMCWQECGINLRIKDGKLIGAEGDPESLLGGGYTCERVRAIPEFHYHSDRLNYPMKRAGKRGEGKWERISWDQAMDEISEKLIKIRDQYGPEAVSLNAGTVHEPADYTGWRFANYWGTPNIFAQGKNCGSASILTEVAMYGWDSLGANPYPGETKTIVSWGSNHAHSNNTKWNVTQLAMEMGATLVCVDPRYTEVAAKADLWLQIRPGTDGALGWGVINVIIEENLYDKEFVEKWCLDFDKVVERAKEYPLDKVSEITGIPARDIIEFAHLYADGPTCQLWGVACCQIGGKASQSASHAQKILIAITGNVDRKGGNPQTGPHKFLDYFDVNGYRHFMNNQNVRECVTADKFPLCSVASFRRAVESVQKVWDGQGYGASQYFLYSSPRGLVDAMRYGDPYPIKALFIQGGNPLCNIPNAKNWYEAMKCLDLSVCMDWYMTPSAAMCDYVLPAADFVERPYLMVFEGVTNSTMAMKQPMEVLYERKDDYYMWKEIAKRTGMAGEWPDTIEGLFDLFLRKTGISWQELADQDFSWLIPDEEYQRYEKQGFGTPSGKVELLPSLFAAAGLDPMPQWEEQPQSKNRTPELAKEYPYRLLSGLRIRPWWHSQHRQLKTLRWMHPYPVVEINPETARKLNIVNGEMVYIETPLGRVRQKARVTEGIQPDVISAEAYWYFPEQPEEEPSLFGVWETNINAIISDEFVDCDFAGDNPMRGCLCKIYKASTAFAYDSNPGEAEGEILSSSGDMSVV